MKNLVETTGEFQLIDPSNGQFVPHFRPAVIEETQFTSTRMGKGQLKLLGNLKDEATDEEFVNYLKESDGDHDLAVSSFLSAFGVDAEPAKPSKPAPAPAKPAKPAAPAKQD